MNDDIVTKIKYPKMYHLPWGDKVTKDDRKLKTDNCFKGKEVVVTEKMDGENTTIASNYWHARSLTNTRHWSRSYIAQLQALLHYKLDTGYRICGENMFAQHTILYNKLPVYFLVHSIWRDHYCLSWYETQKIIKLLDLVSVPVLYTGIYNPKEIQDIVNMSMHKSVYSTHENSMEGYVIKNTSGFNLEDFHSNVGKYVYPKFKQSLDETEEHWLYKSPKPNMLARY